MKKNKMQSDLKNSPSMKIIAKNKKEIIHQKMIITRSTATMVVAYAGLLIACGLIGKDVGETTSGDSAKKGLRFTADAVAFVAALISWCEIVDNEGDHIFDASKKIKQRRWVEKAESCLDNLTILENAAKYIKE